jgi:hypothetical protein
MVSYPDVPTDYSNFADLIREVYEIAHLQGDEASTQRLIPPEFVD